jgi:hypothetical protein
LMLSAADYARLREIADAHPAEAAAVESAVIELLARVVTPFEGRMFEETQLNELLASLVEVIVSCLAPETSKALEQREVLILLTRHAIMRARGPIVRRLIWAKRN